MVGVFSVAGTASAQEGIDRRIEVTRQYIPEVGEAEKLDFMPAHVDTVALQPEINYSITPTPWKGVFDAEPINPIKIDAQQYRPQQPFFARFAAGLPLQSLADLYITANPSSRTAFGAYLNHYGRWAEIENDLGNREDATATHNVVGAFFERRFARKTLSVDISDTYRYYSAFGVIPFSDPLISNTKLGYNDLSGRVVFGDPMLDLSRFNYRVGVMASYFSDREKTTQNDFAFFFDSGWRLYGGDFTAGLYFDVTDGTGMSSEYSDWELSVSPKYDFKVKDLNVSMGLDFVYNELTDFNIFPEIEVTYDRSHGFIPYLRIDGKLEDGSFRTLTYANPYVLSGMNLPNPSHYDFRVGAHGSVARALSYDLFFSAAIWNDYNNFVNDVRIISEEVDASRFAAMTFEKLTILNFGAVLKAVITRGLTFDLGLKVNLVLPAIGTVIHSYNGYGVKDTTDTGIWGGLGIPPFNLDAVLKYNYRDRLFLSAGVEVMGARHFTSAWESIDLDDVPYLRLRLNKVPVGVNLKFDAEYRIGNRLSAFVRGDNLLGQRLYRYNYYPELGANVMLGVKVVF